VRSHLVDALIALTILLFSASLAYDILGERQLNTLREQLPPAVMLACGRGLVDPITPAAALDAFRRRQRSSLSCADATGGEPVQTPVSEVVTTRYGVYGVALALRLFGISWRTIDMYLAFVFAISMVLTYALLRLALGRVLSLVGVVMIVASNHALAVAMAYRDYGKEIWFVAAWLGIGLLLRRSRLIASRAIYGPAAIIGAVLGIGLGFRVDLIIVIPAVVGVIALAIRGRARQALMTKGLALLIFLASFGVTAAPILATFAKASSLSHVIVLGLMTPFTRTLDLEPPVYDLGDLYSDGFAQYATYTHAALVDRDRTFGPQRTAEYDRQGWSLLIDAARRFPADFMMRGIAATRQTLGHPFDPAAASEAGRIDALRRTAVRRGLLRARNACASLLDGRELVLIAIAFLVIAMRDRRLAIVATLLVLYFGSYFMLQFSRRHTFHFDAIAIGIALIAVGGIVSFVVWLFRRWLSPQASPASSTVTAAAPAAAVGVVLFGALVVSLMLLRAWQQRHVTGMLMQTLSAPSVEIDAVREPLALPLASEASRGSWQRFALTRPAIWSASVLLRPGTGTWPQSPPRAAVHAEYLIVDLGGPQCAAGPMPIILKYSSKSGTVYADFSREFYPLLTDSLQLLTPIIEIPGASRFDGVVVPAARVACVRGIRRVNPPDAVPFPNVFVMLPAQWRATPLYQRFRDDPEPPDPLSVIQPGEY
jgi:hypothetical protein